MPHPHRRRGAPLDIAVCLTPEGFGREVFAGVVEHLAVNPAWKLHTPQGLGAQPISDLPGWRGHGMITDQTEPSRARFLRSRPFPVVVTRVAFGNHGLPAVWPDDAAIGRMAAEHLLQCRLPNFAFAGNSGHRSSRERFASFHARLAEEGIAPAVLDGVTPFYQTGPGPWRPMHRRLRAWVRALPKPCSIYAFADPEAAEVLLACQAEGIAIPEQVAVLGTNDESLVCPLTSPPLSSVRWPARAVGREAAQLLDRLIAGAPTPRTPLRIQPPGVAVRTSTDFIALGDPSLVRAVSLARSEAPHRDIGVDELARAAGMSLRTFSRKFTAAAGRTPHAEIARLRMQHACELLTRTGLPIKEIADRLGFPTPEAFCRFFRKQRGLTPGTFRTRIARVTG